MESARGIVLNAVRLNDTHTVVTIYTECAGTVAFVVRRRQDGGGRKTRAAVWQALSVVSVGWEPVLRRELQTPTWLVLERPWKTLACDVTKTAMCLYLGEFLHHALRGEAENGALFSFLEQALTWWDERADAEPNFHLFLLMHLTSFLGFGPGVQGYVPGACFDLCEASFAMATPMHTAFLSPDDARYVPIFWRMSMQMLHGVRLNGATRRRILTILAEYYRLHLPEFSSPKSLEILAEVMAVR